MASPNVHPEFGYLCVSPRLRRDLRVAAYSILLGAVVGAAGIIALGAGGNGNSNAPASMPAATSGGESVPFAKSEGTPAATVSDVATDGIGTPDAVTPAPKSLTPKTRRVRVRDAADIAAVPIGRTPPAEVNAPSSPVVSPPEAPHATPASAEVTPDNATAAPPPPVAAPKKPQKTARNQNRRRDESADDFAERADGGFGRSYADESPRSRRTARGYGDDERPRGGFGRVGAPPPAGPFGPGGMLGALFGGGF